jgi:hypothetical protein
VASTTYKPDKAIVALSRACDGADDEPVGAVDVGEHQDVEEFGATSKPSPWRVLATTYQSDAWARARLAAGCSVQWHAVKGGIRCVDDVRSPRV